MSNPDKTLADREVKYGAFGDNANISQRLKDVMESGKSWEALTDVQAEVLQMICTKMSRILGGDPKYIDNWHDIAGYAKLAEEELGTKREP